MNSKNTAKKGIVSILTTAALLLSVFSAGLPSFATELALRDSFEVNFDGWTTNSDFAELTAHPDEGVKGGRAMQLSNRRCASDGAVSQKGFYLDGGVNYNYSVFVRHDELTAQTFTLSLSWLNYDTGVTGSKVIATQSVKGGAWTELRASFAAPKGTEALTLSLGSNSTANFMFDEFSATFRTMQSAFTVSANAPSRENAGLKDVYANHFRVGNILNGTTVRNNTITAMLLREYNSITMENEGKPDQTMSRANSTNDNIRINFGTGASAIMEFCVRNNIPMRGHTLTWHGQTPDWFFLANMQDTTNWRQRPLSEVPWATAAVMTGRHESYIQNKFAEYARQYPALNIYSYDVVNEFVRVDGNRGGPRLPGFDGEGAGGAGAAPGASPWQAIYGADSMVWLQNAFTFARRHAPEHTKLFYNDYNEYHPPKRDYIIANILRPLFTQGLLDGMGMQGHISADPGGNAWSRWALVRDAMDAYAAIGAGFEVQLTEVDVVTDNGRFADNQVNVYRNIFEHAIAVNARGAGQFTAICMWGPNDANSWITRRAGRENDAPLLHNRENAPKPAHAAVFAVVPEAQWGDGRNPEFLYNAILTAEGGSEPPVITPPEPIEPDSRGYFFHSTFEEDTDNWGSRGGAGDNHTAEHAFLGQRSLLISARAAPWHGASRPLDSLAFVSGNSYSFSVFVAHDGRASDGDETFALTLQYTDTAGETRWATIAEAQVPPSEVIAPSLTWVQLANRNFTIPAGATNLELIVETRDENTLPGFFMDEAIGAVGGTLILAPSASLRYERENIAELCEDTGVQQIWRVTRVYDGDVLILEHRGTKRNAAGGLITIPEPPTTTPTGTTTVPSSPSSPSSPNVTTTAPPVITTAPSSPDTTATTAATTRATTAATTRATTAATTRVTTATTATTVVQPPVNPPGTFTITFNANGGTALSPATRTTDVHGHLMNVMPTPVRAASGGNEWAFAGWFTATTGGSRVLTGATGTEFTANTTVYARWTQVTRRTVADTPAAMRQNFDWLKNVRHEEPLRPNTTDGERVFFNRNGTIRAQNFIFDQIWAGNGTVNWAVRWESSTAVTLVQRQQIARMLHEEINKWTRPLIGMEGWPFGEIQVEVIGWAVSDAALILDRRPNEQIWVNNTHNPPLGDANPRMASAPNNISRFNNFRAVNAGTYQYPGGLHNRFDMYLWGTQGFGGGAGGDWGTRVSDTYITRAANGGATMIITHEVGHGFGLYDFYGGVGVDRPPATSVADSTGNRNFGSGDLRTVMHVGAANNVTPYDEWQIRYYWDWIYNHPTAANRFRLPT